MMLTSDEFQRQLARYIQFAYDNEEKFLAEFLPNTTSIKEFYIGASNCYVQGDTTISTRNYIDWYNKNNRVIS